MLRGISNLLNKDMNNRVGSGGRLSMAQGYHFCTFFAVGNIANQIGYLVVIGGGGNGQFLCISVGQQPLSLSAHSSVFVHLSGHTVMEDRIEIRKAKRGG
jgi:hypothetical protein